MGGRSGGGGGDAKLRVTNYHLDLLLGVCWGPVTLLREVWYGEKLLFGTNVGEGRLFNIYEPDLFGGQRQEGGAQGAVWFMRGGRRQVLPSRIASMLYGRDPEDCPGYRNICCIGLTRQSGGEPGYYDANNTHLHYRDGEKPSQGEYGGWAATSSNEKAFLVGANNPYLKPFWVEVTRASEGFFPERALIYRTAADRAAYERGDALTTILGKPDSNLVHVLFETLTNTEWGIGIPFSAFDYDSWKVAAQAAYDELLGGSFLWTRPMTGEKFAQMIADHIRAMLFPDPETGLLSIKLIRRDYQEANLPVFDPDNSRLTELSIRDSNEVVNEVVVEWTNPETYENETVAVQDLASIATLGERISEKHSYTFFCRVDLAWDAASRDVLAKTAPMRTMTLELPPSSERRRPGEVVRVQFPEEGANDVIARVMRVQTGSPGGRVQTLTLLEDVMAELAVIGQAHDGAWGTPTSTSPKPPLHFNLFTLPYYMVQKAGVRGYSDGEEHGGLLMSAQQTGIYAFKLTGTKIRNTGGTYTADLAEIGVSRHGTLAESLQAETTSSDVSLNLDGYGPEPEVGDYLLIGNNTHYSEIALITAVTSSGVTLRRGVMDTVPIPHAFGIQVWLVPNGTRVHDSTPRSEGEKVDYKAQSMTFFGVQPIKNATERSYTLPSRAERPLRPANVRLDNSQWGGANGSPRTTARNFTVHWSNRNRKKEDNVLLGWEEGNVALEAGTSVVVRVDDEAGNFVLSRKGNTGTSVDISMSSEPAGVYKVRVWTERDSDELRSFHEVERLIRIN